MKCWLAGWSCSSGGIDRRAVPAWAQKTVTFAYQDMMNPWRWVQQSQEIEKATGFKINWRQFGGGGDVIRAMASGDVQLGEVGSTGDRDGDQPGHGRRAVLDSRGHRRRRRHWSRATAAASTRSPTSRARRSARRSSRPRISSCSTRCRRRAQADRRAGPQHASAGNRRRMGARRHRRDVHLGSGALDGQEERQGADDLGRHLQEGRVHVRRLDRQPRSSRRRIRSSWSRWSRRVGKADADYRGESQGLDRRLGRRWRRSPSGRAASPRTWPTRWRSTVSRACRTRRRPRGSAAAPTARRPRRWRSRPSSSRSRAGCTTVAPDFSKTVTTECVTKAMQ